MGAGGGELVSGDRAEPPGVLAGPALGLEDALARVIALRAMLAALSSTIVIFIPFWNFKWTKFPQYNCFISETDRREPLIVTLHEKWQFVNRYADR